MTAVVAADQGWSAREAADIAEITYRQLDYWCRTDLIRPSLVDAHGSGHRRRYSSTDIGMLCFIKQMLDSGIRLDVIRSAIETFRTDGLRDGTIVVVRGTEVRVFDPSVGLDAMMRWFRDGPCHTFPITFPNMTRGTCSTIGRIHTFPHIQDRSCTAWKVTDA